MPWVRFREWFGALKQILAELLVQEKRIPENRSRDQPMRITPQILLRYRSKSLNGMMKHILLFYGGDSAAHVLLCTQECFEYTRVIADHAANATPQETPLATPHTAHVASYTYCNCSKHND